MVDKGCLMIKFNIPNFNELQSKLIQSNEELHEEGLEKEPHVTILYGFETGPDINELKKLLSGYPINYLGTTFNKISIFENEKYDVLKFDATCKALDVLHKKLKDTYGVTTQFETYHPHMTIGYLKCGNGKKYIRRLNKPFMLFPNSFKYSSPRMEPVEFQIF